MQNYKDGVLDAYGLLQIDPINRDEEWETDRKEWVNKWGSIILNDAPNTQLNSDHVQSNAVDAESCSLCGPGTEIRKMCLKCHSLIGATD
jgi:hypothetical protein